MKVFAIVLLVLLVSGISYPQIPNRVSYQGLLTTSTGAPAASGTYDLKFEIFNASSGGVLRFSETQTGVTIVDGTFSVALGSVATLGSIFGEPLWVEVTALSGPGIGAPVMFSPRSDLLSVPYSLAPWVPGTSGTIHYNSGNVGIGTITPTAKLHIAGTAGVDGIKFPDGTVQTTASTGGGGGGWTDDGSTVRLSTGSDQVGIGTTSPANRLQVALSNSESGDFTATPSALGLLNTDLTTNNWSLLSFQCLDGPGTNLINAARIGTQITSRSTNWVSSDLIFATAKEWTATERVRITSDGNVGIMTATPQSRLTLATNDYSPNGILTIHDESLQAWVPIVQRVTRGGNFVTNGTPIGGLDQQVWKSGGWTSLSWMKSTYKGDGYSDLSQLDFGTSGSTQMTIHETGNVGIGTSSPANALQLHRSGSTTSALHLTNGLSGATSTDGLLVNYHFTSGAEFWNYENTDMWFGTNSTRRMTISKDGNVGIGTETPGVRLQVAGDDATTTYQPATASFGILNTNTTANNWSILSFQGHTTGGAVARAARIGAQITAHNASNLAADLVFSTANSGTETQHMRITSGGNIGIGASTPGNKLVVQTETDGDGVHLKTSSSVGIGYILSHTFESSSGQLGLAGFSGNWLATASSGDLILDNDNAFNLLLGTNNTERLRITGLGNVGIATSSPLEKLQVDGAIRATSNAADFQSGSGINMDYFDVNKIGRIAVNRAGTNDAGLGISVGDGSLTAVKISFSGNVGIGLGTTDPGSSNLLELSSTTKGFVLPRMTKTERDAISSPVAGMMIYQTDNTPGLRVYDGTNWMRFTETAD